MSQQSIVEETKASLEKLKEKLGSNCVYDICQKQPWWLANDIRQLFNGEIESVTLTNKVIETGLQILEEYKTLATKLNAN